MKTNSFEHIECEHCSNRFKSVFCKVENDFIKEIESMKVCSTYKKGQIIFQEGGYSHGVYCINRGKVKLSKNGDLGKDQIVRLAKPGDILGYRSILSGDKLSASAITLEDSNVCFIPKDIFVNILKKDSALSFEMMKLLSDDLRRAEDAITHLAQKPVRERTAETLLFLKETYGFEEDGKTINVQLSREDLANIVGTATETVVRFLTEFKNDKIIELLGKKITIINYNELVHLANMYD